MKDKYIQGIYNEYAGLLDQKLADLHILLRNPVGVGEHGSISDEIKTKIVEIDRYQSLVNTLKVLFEPSSEGDGPTSSAGDRS